MPEANNILPCPQAEGSVPPEPPEELSVEEIVRGLMKLAPRLTEDIARCCEQAYRRGYQQGALYGTGLDQEVIRWRFFQPNDMPERYSVAIAPPDNRGPGYGFSCSAFERLSMEAGNASSLICHLCAGIRSGVGTAQRKGIPR